MRYLMNFSIEADEDQIKKIKAALEKMIDDTEGVELMQSHYRPDYFAVTESAGTDRPANNNIIL